jgi:cystathionine beta-lyase/cystathionine gamma-synthase
VSWGGYESLVFPAGVKFPDDKVPEDRIGLVRVHIGIETKELLIQDLAQALDGMNG